MANPFLDSLLASNGPSPLAQNPPAMSDQELIDQIAALGGIPDMQALYNRRALQGFGQYQTPQPQGMHVGNTYKAASPLEHLSVALERIMGGRAQQKAESDFENSVAQQTAGRRAYIGRQWQDQGEQMRVLRRLLGMDQPTPQAQSLTGWTPPPGFQGPS